jgi:hypothetical protein
MDQLLYVLYVRSDGKRAKRHTRRGTPEEFGGGMEKSDIKEKESTTRFFSHTSLLFSRSINVSNDVPGNFSPE